MNKRNFTLACCLSVMAATTAQAEQPDWLKDVSDRLTVHGYAQGGYTWQRVNETNTNTFDVKRTLLWVDARITDRWSFLFMHDFNSVVQEYYTDYRITRDKGLTVRLGQFKNGCTMENPWSPTAMETIDVYSEGVTYLSGCGSDPLFGVQYGRDLGLSVRGELANGKFAYDVQLMNGQGICQIDANGNKRASNKDMNNKKDGILRLEYRPCKGLNLVATGQLGWGHALVDKPIFCPDIAKGDDYRRNRWTVGFDYKSKPLNVHGEYIEGKDGQTISRGAYVTGSVPLYKGLDFVASYDFFNFNVDKDMSQHKVVAGLQYWFFKKCRFQVQYVYKNALTDYKTSFEHCANHSVMCQMQVRFN